jgi:thioredoxin-related protein
MRFLCVATCALALSLLVASAPVVAERDPATIADETAEVLVFEIQGCGYCQSFREQLGARYIASTTNKLAPLRFVDLNKHDADAFPLSGPVTVLPTIVLLRDGKEIDRLEGYPLSEAMFRMVQSNIGKGF